MNPTVDTPAPSGDQAYSYATGRSGGGRNISVLARKHEESGTPDELLLHEAHERFLKVKEWESAWRQKSVTELDFLELDHWKESDRALRDGLPCLSFDRIGPSIDQVVNDARQAPPEGKITPVGGGADKYTAEVLQGLVRNIDQDSSAEISYMTAYEYAVKIGRGWWRIRFAFEDEESWKQKLLIERIPNPFSVYPDPAAQQFDYSDMMYCFVTEDLDLGIFRQEYGDDTIAGGLADLVSTGDRQQDEWYPKGAVRVAEYWWVEITESTTCRLADGSGVPLADVPEGAIVIDKRTVRKRTVKWAKITGAEVLDQGVWPGKWIPLVPVLGREVIKKGRRTLRGMIGPAMDSNLMFDFIASKIAEGFGLAPISQWLMAVGQVENLESSWQEANRKPKPYLLYNPADVNGNLLPPPQRITPQINMGELTAGLKIFADSTKADLSTFDANLGAPGPEQSGKAILARQKEGDNAHFNYLGNLRRSIRHSVLIELDLIPHIYNEQQAITITDPDGSNHEIAINQETFYKGLTRIFNIGKDKIGPARFDVVVGEGISYASQRAQMASDLVQMAQSMPIVGQRAPDLIAKALGADDELVLRLKPADVAGNEDGQAPIPPQIQQKLAMDQQVIQHLMASVQALESTIKAKILELESKERISSQNNATKVYTAEALSKDAAVAHLAELDHAGIKHDLAIRADLLHDKMTIEADASQQEAQHAHEAQLQQQQAQQPQPAGA